MWGVIQYRRNLVPRELRLVAVLFNVNTLLDRPQRAPILSVIR
jgi:hypothetical protein